MGSDDWKQKLQPLFAPQSIAIIGASDAPAGFTNMAYQYLVKYGYKGTVYPVHPKRDQVWDIPCHKTISEIEGPVDQVIIGIRAQLVPQILTECGEKGVKSAVVFSSGFKEIGSEEGLKAQEEIASIAEKYRIRLCGPNCVGIASIKDSTVCFSAPLPANIPIGKVAYISQSATMAANIVSSGVDNGVRFACAISSGNEAVLEISDYIQFLLREPDVDIIAAYVESFKDPDKFRETVELAIKMEKPIIVLKLGKSDKAKKVAASHTGALTGTYEVNKAVFRQKGIISVESNEEMIETIKLFSFRKPVKKGGVGFVGGSGGACAYFADRSDDIGLEIPDFSKETEAKIKEVLPSFGTVHNPLDATGQIRTDLPMFESVCKAILEDENIGTLIYASGITRSLGIPSFQPIFKTFIETARKYPEKMHAFVSANMEAFTKEINEFLEEYSVPLLQGGGIGLRAVKSLIDYNRFLTDYQEADPGQLLIMDQEEVEKWKQSLLNRSKGITEKDAKNLLDAYGINVPKGSIVMTLGEAEKAAENYGYPLVLKINSGSINHKSDIGGIKFIYDKDELTQSFRELETVAQKLNSDEGFLIEEMVEKGVEVIIGIQKDEFFGPIIMLGLGGIYTELFRDVTFKLPPLTRHEARAMVNEIEASRLFYEFRNRPECDVDALVDVILKLSSLAIDFSDAISEMDLNPVVVLEKGKGVVALDALLVTA